MARIYDAELELEAQAEAEVNKVTVKDELDLSSTGESTDDEPDADAFSFNICDRCGRNFLSRSALQAHLNLYDSANAIAPETTVPGGNSELNVTMDEEGKKASLLNS